MVDVSESSPLTAVKRNSYSVSAVKPVTVAIVASVAGAVKVVHFELDVFLYSKMYSVTPLWASH
jgi:hypothetical protein